jgi:NADH-quinone oxidoreductase subunit A
VGGHGGANGRARTAAKGVEVRDYLPILVMIVLVILFVGLSFVASTLLSPRRPTAAKRAPYECGIVPEQEPAERFPVKFYLVAMAFIVLDVEIIFLYPFTTVFRGLAVYGLVVMGVFLGVLLVPFAYLLSTGALDWGPVKQLAVRSGTAVLRAAGMPGRAGLDPSAPATEPGDDEGKAA